MHKLIRASSLALLVVLFLGVTWFLHSTDSQITAVRNTLQYHVSKGIGGPPAFDGGSTGQIGGTVRTTTGVPVESAVVLVASPLGDTYAAQSGPDGTYHIADVPPGRYVPIAGKRGFDDAVNQTCLAGLCRKDRVTVRPGTTTLGIDLTLAPLTPPEIVVDDSLIVSPTMEVEVGAPFPSRSLRTHLSFERAGLRVNDCWVYEPLEGEGPFPTMLLVLPGPVKFWEIIPVPFAAQGFNVLACYPLRGIDIDEDAADLLTALAYVRQGRVPSHADPERLALVGASFTSLHTYRLLGLTDLFDTTLVLGGMADGFRFRRDVELGTAHARPPFDEALIALGFPNSSPELYFRYSVMYHLDGLPPMCLLHGLDDELVPFSQGVLLDRTLTDRQHPHEFHSYEGLSHYFSTSADNVTTQQMWQDALSCVRATLPGP